jgi:hypothetical protein
MAGFNLVITAPRFMFGPFCEWAENVSGSACDPCATDEAARQHKFT